MEKTLQELLTTVLGTGGVATILAWLARNWFLLQLERFKREQNQQLEAIKAELALATRLRSVAEEKRAQVAGEGLVAILRYLRALEATADVVMWAAPSDAPDDHKATVEHTMRWQLLEPVEGEFRRGWIGVETFLPDSCTEIMEAVWKERNEIRANQMTWLAVSGQAGVNPSFFERGFGSVPRKAIEELRARSKTIFRPIAQLKSLDKDDALTAASAAEQGVAPDDRPRTAARG